MRQYIVLATRRWYLHSIMMECGAFYRCPTYQQTLEPGNLEQHMYYVSNIYKYYIQVYIR